MIGIVMELIRKEVDAFVKFKHGITGEVQKVALLSFVDTNGNLAIPVNEIGLCLLNIEEEKMFKSTGRMPATRTETTTTFLKQPINLNLQIMFAANFVSYQDGLAYIADIIACFQNKPVFDVENTPELLDMKTKKLVFEINSINLEQLHYIWSVIGTRYLPSTIFKVKMLSIQEQEETPPVANIREITTEINTKEVND